MYKEIQRQLESKASKERARISQSFFKTGKGEYGEGDIFIGVTVPEQREIARKYATASLRDIEFLLKSKVHEYRLTALILLINQFRKAKEEQKKELFDFYIQNKKGINSWDLVDLSAPNILGLYLLDKEKDILYELAQSNDLWEKRIAIVSTLGFIRKMHFEDTLNISEIFLKEKHDLMHKAVGWILREVGKKDQSILEDFLKKYATIMPRTMLRYAIERFPQEKRKFYLQKTFKA